jgi:hypothetical protein
MLPSNVVKLREHIEPCCECKFCQAEDNNYRYSVCIQMSKISTELARHSKSVCGVLGHFFIKKV